MEINVEKTHYFVMNLQGKRKCIEEEWRIKLMFKKKTDNK